VAVRDTDVLLLPKTRVPVPVQPVPYDAIQSLELHRPGMSGGKIAAIGIASGVGACLLLFLGLVMAME
jgi:hypothetical protein